ncbi:MAG: hypothetical protein HC837_21510, partial [Chloroflexaceae bacterium]|nr:hypothetical protein [Chloroflexaceae bacterium]
MVASTHRPILLHSACNHRSLVHLIHVFLVIVLLLTPLALLPVPTASLLAPAFPHGPLASDAVTPSGADALPEGLSAADWQSIQQQIAAAEYHLVAATEADVPRYHAPNRANGLTVTLDADGIALAVADTPWHWQMQLVGYGYGVPEHAAGDATLQVTQNRMDYARGNLREWYVNSAQGIKQTFELERRPAQPATPAPLVFDLAVQTSLTPRLAEHGQEVTFVDVQGQPVLVYDRLVVYDAQGQTLPAHMALPAVGAGQPPRVRLVVDDQQAVYPLTVDPFIVNAQSRWLVHTEVARLNLSDGLVGDLFGRSVALDETGTTLVVGVPGRDNATGDAYVFERNQSGDDLWGQVARLSASDRVVGDNFGVSVAISGDTVVVGAALVDIDGQPDQGAAYVFERDQGGTNAWGEVAKLTSSDGAASDVFGTAVAISGNVVLIGAQLHDTGGNSNQGAAYLFGRNQGGNNAWGELTKLGASNGAAGNEFGSAVALQGNTAVVGDTGTPVAAYVFERNQGGTNAWGEAAVLDQQTDKADLLSVAINEDASLIVLGSPFNTGGTTDDATVYVYERVVGCCGVDTWTLVDTLTSDSTAAFGINVAISGTRIAVDTRDDAIVGEVRLFERSDDGWIETARTVENSVGRSGLALRGDTLIAGAAQNNGNQGETVVVYLSANNGTGQQQLVTDDGAANDLAGSAVAIDETASIVVVGASQADIGGSTNQGAAYVFARHQDGAESWGQVAKLTASSGNDNDAFGTSVAI